MQNKISLRKSVEMYMTYEDGYILCKDTSPVTCRLFDKIVKHTMQRNCLTEWICLIVKVKLFFQLLVFEKKFFNCFEGDAVQIPTACFSIFLIYNI